MTIVTRESDFDDYTRSRIFALMAWEAQKCPGCGNYDVLVEFKDDKRHYVWDEHQRQRVEVVQYRCLACGAADVIRRDWNEKHSKDQTSTGYASPADGRLFMARPVDDEEV
jgi:predicted RNA-binding Zn-ribbon protein involved in translation (DUF1610 family)